MFEFDKLYFHIFVIVHINWLSPTLLERPIGTFHWLTLLKNSIWFTVRQQIYLGTCLVETNELVYVVKLSIES